MEYITFDDITYCSNDLAIDIISTILTIIFTQKKLPDLWLSVKYC